MTFLVFANDFVTMSLATDNVRTTPNPNKWNVRNITIASALIGALLVLSGTAAMLVGVRYLHLDAGAMQTFVMLLLVFMSQFRVLIVRERRFFWSSRPGGALVLSTIGTLVGFALLGGYGVFVAPLTSAQVAVVFGFSLVATLVIDVPKHLIFKKILE
jgi:H+-transporting ATPase